ncbi:MAG: type II toxin-antitoxin system Phd/YefM family antitoxin [Coriobacteriales bacterium]|nr:type II toxin-antitoxin system Phd/YefM family antitoxin [Coriobacteriales bacterium]
MGISLIEDVKPISYIKTNAADMLAYINDSKNPIIITQSGEARGVMLDIGSYQKMTDALILMKLIERSDAGIGAGAAKSHAHVFARLEEKLAQHER